MKSLLKEARTNSHSLLLPPGVNAWAREKTKPAMTVAEQKITGRPTWAEIDLDALAHNFHLIRDRVGQDVNILAAVKADAYGHGAVECARRLAAEGVDWFGVALPEEGLELREARSTHSILCLAGFWRGQVSACLQQRLTPVVYSLDAIEAFNRAA